MVNLIRSIFFVILLLVSLGASSQCDNLCSDQPLYEKAGKVFDYDTLTVTIDSMNTKGMRLGHEGFLYQLDGSRYERVAETEQFLHYDELWWLSRPEFWVTMARAAVLEIQGSKARFQIVQKRYQTDSGPSLEEHFGKNYTMVFRASTFEDGHPIEKRFEKEGLLGKGCGCGSINFPIGTWKFYDSKGVLIKEAWLNENREEEGPVIYYYPSGDTSEVGSYLDKRKDGWWREFHENGRLAKEIFYRHGDPDGPQRTYHENGQLASQGTVDDDGSREGEWILYHPNGQLEAKMTYDSFGETTGPYEEYYSNGKVKRKGEYSSSGNKDGEWREYHENGHLYRKMIYHWSLGLETLDEYDQNGNSKLAVKYDRGNITNYAEFYENGNVKVIKEFRSDQLTGEYFEYHENGQLKASGTYVSDRKYGWWIEFYSNGQKIQTVRYEKGQKDGPVTVYHENGNIKMIAAYQLGELHRDYRDFYPNKKKKSKGQYENGEKIGKWKYWDGNGKKTTVNE